MPLSIWLGLASSDVRLTAARLPLGHTIFLEFSVFFSVISYCPHICEPVKIIKPEIKQKQNFIFNNREEVEKSNLSHKIHNIKNQIEFQESNITVIVNETDYTIYL